MQRFNVLLQQTELSALSHRNKEAHAAQTIWAQIAPDNLAELSHINSIKNGQLTVLAHNNAVAAKIKLLSPSLLIQLEKKGYEVTAIRVKVQVKSAPQAKTQPRKSLSTEARNQLALLKDKLSGTQLGDALSRLLKNSR
ncbi:MAG: DciA family protein [Methylotenera sp.]|jgi:hypothetical protein|nr:DciA family protein [Methylotenera sp.]